MLHTTPLFVDTQSSSTSQGPHGSSSQHRVFEAAAFEPPAVSTRDRFTWRSLFSQCVPSSKPRWFGGCASISAGSSDSSDSWDSGRPRWQVPFAKCWSAAKAREAYKDGPSVIFWRWSSTSTCGKLMAKKKGLPSGNDWHSYWTWPFIVDVPIVNGDFP